MFSVYSAESTCSFKTPRLLNKTLFGEELLFQRQTSELVQTQEFSIRKPEEVTVN